MREFYNDALKIVIFVLAVYWNDVVGEITDDLVADLYNLYQEVYNDSDNTNNRPASARRVFKQNELYSVHINKLREVNGYKRHNLLVKFENLSENNPIVYINNPVESKIPKAYLTLEEFRTALISRANKNMHTFDPISKLREAKKDLFNNARPIVTAKVKGEKKQTNTNNYGVQTIQRKPLNVNKNQENNINKNKYSSFSLKRRPTIALKMGSKETKTSRISQKYTNKLKEITINVNLHRAALFNNIPIKPNSEILKTKNILQYNNYNSIKEKGNKYAKGASISLIRLSNNSTFKDDEKKTISTTAFFALSNNKATDSKGQVTSNETIDHTTYMPPNTVPENASSTNDTQDSTATTELKLDNITITISTNDSTTEIVPDDETTDSLITATDDNTETTEALTLDTASNIPTDNNTGAHTIDKITTDIPIDDYTENTEFHRIDTTPTANQTDDTKNTETVTDDSTTTVDYTDDSETVPDADSGNDSNDLDPIPPEMTTDSTEDSNAITLPEKVTTDNDKTMEKTNENTPLSSNTLLRTSNVTRTSSTWRTYARPRVFVG